MDAGVSTCQVKSTTSGINVTWLAKRLAKLCFAAEGPRRSTEAKNKHDSPANAMRTPPPLLLTKNNRHGRTRYQRVFAKRNNIKMEGGGAVAA